MLTKIDSIYRLVSISFFVVLGLTAVWFRFVPTLYGPDILGDEALAFGMSCLLAAFGYMLLDLRLVKAGTPELD